MMIDISPQQWMDIWLQAEVAHGEDILASDLFIRDPESARDAIDLVLASSCLNIADRCLLIHDHGRICRTTSPQSDQQIHKQVADLLGVKVSEVRRWELIGGLLNRQAVKLLRRTYLLSDLRVVRYLADLHYEAQIEWAQIMIFTPSCDLDAEMLAWQLGRAR